MNLGESQSEAAGRADPPPLTRREQEVLELVLQRKCDKEIAQALGISRRTVEKHVEHLLRKLGVRSRREVISRSPKSENT